MFFICPICNKPLYYTNCNRSVACENGHCFDFAKEGYLYLLPPNKKHSKSPGDDQEMVAARRRFLSAGHYQLFSNALNEIACRCVSVSAPILLDAGCGEGYYTERLAVALRADGKKPEVFGCDISKEAVRHAAKAAPDLSFAVASSFSLPMPNASVDLLTDVFAPVVPEEFRRVTKPGGYFVLAVPSARHLFGLKEILYDAPYENEKKETTYSGFCFCKRVPVRGNLTLTGQDVQDLFAMTPYFWKTPKEGIQKLERVSSLTTEIGFDFLVYRREFL
ncbi:MAG TPA: 50S rRNA methyltransferase [Ruminococcaceae bacterium]|jgi:23S rRNA (guanine745-N1)-methyltransferase|nr:50S rRNA methyltransferase [Oscillospiraceae bacterium]HCC02426.1 50S rRNA methyltransferase [Oscillospiraceae bacterium]HCM24504.1 50S rRNA methyltransferase [Oscillospiraceae bacterium]